MDLWSLIVTLVMIAIVLGIAYAIVMKIPGFAGNWIVQAVFGVLILLLVIGLFTGGIPVLKLRS